jgi:hypothetical protein
MKHWALRFGVNLTLGVFVGLIWRYGSQACAIGILTVLLLNGLDQVKLS